MTTEYLPQKIDLALIGESHELYDYFRKLIGQIEELVQNTNTEVNYLLVSGGVSNTFTLGVPNDSGVYPDGTWRINSTSTGYSIEQYQSGAWTTVATYDANRKLTITNLTVSGISQLGTISSGVWNGAALGAAYVPSHDDLNGYEEAEHVAHSTVADGTYSMYEETGGGVTHITGFTVENGMITSVTTP